MLKERGLLKFEDRWPSMRPVVLKLLKQEPVSPGEWQELFYEIHLVCLWDEKGPAKLRDHLQDDIIQFIRQAQTRVLAQREEQALLKAYIAEWKKFFTQCNYLPTPFKQLENTLQGKSSGSMISSSGGNSSSSSKKGQTEESIVRNMMLDSWNEYIFSNIKLRLQDSAMKLVAAERNGEAFDSQLVIGVRESYVNLCSNSDDKLKIYRENFEAAYISSTEMFYKVKTPEQLQQNGVQAYMRYADAKLLEEEARAQRYLEAGTVSPVIQCCVKVPPTRLSKFLFDMSQYFKTSVLLISIFTVFIIEFIICRQQGGN